MEQKGEYKARWAFMSKWDVAEVVLYMSREIKGCLSMLGNYLILMKEKKHIYILTSLHKQKKLKKK